MTRLLTALCIAPALIGLTSCGDNGQGLMERSLVGQMTVLCSASEYADYANFARSTRRLGLVPDGGSYVSDTVIASPVTQSQWVASTDLGSRSTIWRGSFGAGEFPYRRVTYVDDLGNLINDPDAVEYRGTDYDMRSYESAEVCVLHLDSISRGDGVQMARDFGMSDLRHSWESARTDDGRLVTTAYRLIIEGDNDIWREVEFRVAAPGETGLTIIRRHFEGAGPEPEAEGITY